MVGAGALLYPEAFPRAVGPEHPDAGVLAQVVTDERAELLDPEPLYLRRPDVGDAGQAQAGLVTAAARDRRRRRRGRARWRQELFGADAWSADSVRDGAHRRAPDRVVAEDDGAWSATW